MDKKISGLNLNIFHPNQQNIYSVWDRVWQDTINDGLNILNKINGCRFTSELNLNVLFYKYVTLNSFLFN